MKNFLTIHIESYLGTIFISLLTAFFIGLMSISLKNFGSDITTIGSEQVQIKVISATERELIQDWLKENKIKVPEGVGFRYLFEKYSSRPWLK